MINNVVTNGNLYLTTFTKTMYAIFATCVAYFQPAFAAILLTFVLVMVDFVSGVIASRQRAIERGDTWRITSRRAYDTIYKLVFLCFIILGFMSIEKHLLAGLDVNLFKYAAAFVCGIELYSIIENAYDITGWHGFKLLLVFTDKKVKQATNSEDMSLKQKNKNKRYDSNTTR